MKILCAVDDSDVSHLAIQGMGSLFRSSVKEIILLHVVDSHVVHRGRKPTASETKVLSGVSRKIQEQGKKLLHGCAERLTTILGQGRTGSLPVIKLMLVKGHVSDTILQWSEKTGVDCLTMGSRGISDVPGYLLGSVSRKLVTHALCSVFMVKGPVSVPFPVMIALDGSKSSTYAARIVQAWLNPDEVSLCLVSVVPDRLTDLASQLLGKRQLMALMKPIRRSAQDLLKEYREKFLKVGFRVTTALLEGHPPDQILQAAEHQQAGLVCLGSKGLSGVERFTMGSVSEWVSTYSPLSILVVRHS
ncbi:MAG: universal stress protein [Nitrospirales bacterium]